MADDTKNEVRVPLHDPVPSIFADGLHGANVISGCARIDLFVDRAWQGSTAVQPMVVGRLVIPTARLDQFVASLSELSQRLKKENKTGA